jgi:hypothetical protein
MRNCMGVSRDHGFAAVSGLTPNHSATSRDRADTTKDFIIAGTCARLT